jgi:hypothetical protein
MEPLPCICHAAETVSPQHLLCSFQAARQSFHDFTAVAVRQAVSQESKGGCCG